jgi:hypothetical protein
VTLSTIAVLRNSKILLRDAVIMALFDADLVLCDVVIGTYVLVWQPPCPSCSIVLGNP